MKVPIYQLVPVYTVNPCKFTVGDLMALGSEIVRIASITLNGTVGLYHFDENGEHVRVYGPDGMEKTTVSGLGNLQRVKISREILLKNGFKDISNHTLKGAETFSYTNPKDECHRITVKIADWADCTYFDDRLYHTLESKHVDTLEQLQHILTDDGFDLLLKP